MARQKGTAWPVSRVHRSTSVSHPQVASRSLQEAFHSHRTGCLLEQAPSQVGAADQLRLVPKQYGLTQQGIVLHPPSSLLAFAVVCSCRAQLDLQLLLRLFDVSQQLLVL